MKLEEKNQRDDFIVELYNEGKTTSEIASEVDLSNSRVREILQKKIGKVSRQKTTSKLAVTDILSGLKTVYTVDGPSLINFLNKISPGTTYKKLIDFILRGIELSADKTFNLNKKYIFSIYDDEDDSTDILNRIDTIEKLILLLSSGSSEEIQTIIANTLKER